MLTAFLEVVSKFVGHLVVFVRLTSTLGVDDCPILEHRAFVIDLVTDLEVDIADLDLVFVADPDSWRGHDVSLDLGSRLLDLDAPLIFWLSSGPC